MADMRRDKRLWRFSKLRQAKYLNNIVKNNIVKNNIVKQVHCRVKWLVRSGLLQEVPDHIAHPWLVMKLWR
jgi:hypothetical protein